MTTVSLELCEKLYKKGLSFETGCLDFNHGLPLIRPTVEELLKMIPRSAEFEGKNGYLFVSKDANGYICCYIAEARVIFSSPMRITLVDALGEMCLYLLDNGFVYDAGKREIVKKEK